MVGKNIKRFRTEKGITQDELAEVLNVTRQAVSNWENEKTQPDIETLNSIAETLGVTVEELIYGVAREPVVREIVHEKTVKKTVKEGVTFGSALAMVISYVAWHSIGWAILHGLFGWAYVIYYIIKY